MTHFIFQSFRKHCKSLPYLKGTIKGFIKLKRHDEQQHVFFVVLFKKTSLRPFKALFKKGG